MRDKIVENVRLLLRECSSRLPSRNVEDAQHLLDHDEWGEAWDLLCIQLYEYEVKISEELYALIEQTGTMMELGPEKWTYLRELVS